MEVRTILKPGQNGTKRLLDKYGDQLICIRYRYDKVNHKRFKTIELIIDEQDWYPGVRIPVDEQVSLVINYGETELREAIKAAGGFWDREQKVWRLSYRKVMELGIENRVKNELGF